MLLTTMPLPVEASQEQVRTLWEADPALLPLLRAIVDDVARAGRAARLVIERPRCDPRLLVSSHPYRLPWRALARTVIDRGEVCARKGVIGAPVHGRHGLRGALLLYLDSAIMPSTVHEQVLSAHAARIELALAAANDRLAGAQGTVEALVQMLAAHDPATARHAMMVRNLARIVGRALDVPAHTLVELEWAGLLHDIGKIAVPTTILAKDGPLTDSEWAIMRQHPAIGERIVRAIPELRGTSVAVRHHHERWDGRGYPDRLSGQACPFNARIVSVIDAYETMRTGRPYRKPLERDEALAELRRAAGVQFDPGLLALLPILADHDIAP